MCALNTYSIATWNVQTLNGKGMKRAKELLGKAMDYMKDSRLQMLGLAEIKWGEAGMQRIPHNTGDIFCFFYSGHKKHQHGVGILMTYSMALHLVDWEPVSERIITATFQFGNRTETVVQIYAPTKPRDSPEYCDKDREDSCQFYDKLNSVLIDLKSKHTPDKDTIMGDFNSGVALNNTGLERYMGAHSMDQPKYKRPLSGKRLKNAEWNTNLLMDLCKQFDLCVAGSLFEHSDEHKYTWKHPRYGYKHQLDHILISTSERDNLLDVKNHSVDIDTLQPIDERRYLKSDHRPVVAMFSNMHYLCERNRPSEETNKCHKRKLDHVPNESQNCVKRLKIKFSRGTS